MNLSDRDRICIPVPFYHCFGMVLGNLTAVLAGATMVIPSALFDAARTLSAVEQERCTALYGVPSMFIAELEHPEFDQFCLDTLRTGIMAGSPCPLEVMKKVIEKMHCRDITIASARPNRLLSLPRPPLTIRLNAVLRRLEGRCLTRR